jgi:hypothetical protein
VAQYYEKIEEKKRFTIMEEKLNAEQKNNLLDHKPREKLESTDHNIVNKQTEAFNAAKYLFLSYRLAEQYPELKASQVILQFSTPWPKQSYHHFSDVSKKYDDTYTAFSRSISLVLMFFLANLLAVPLAVQDMIVHAAMTASIGYTILLHVQLYNIFPVLVVIPTLSIGVLIHFFYVSNQKEEIVNKAKMKQLARTAKVEPNKKHHSFEGTFERKRNEDDDSLADLEWEELDDNSSLSTRIVRSRGQHLTRRESLQQGIFVARRLEEDLDSSLSDSSNDPNLEEEEDFDFQFDDDFFDETNNIPELDEDEVIQASRTDEEVTSFLIPSPIFTSDRAEIETRELIEGFFLEEEEEHKEEEGGGEEMDLQISPEDSLVEEP